jgi:hypothetical protein
MKNIIYLLLLSVPFFGFGQVNLSCNLKEICDWDEKKEIWDKECNPFEYNCLFTMNEAETMFTHITESIKSTYYIKEKLSAEDDIFSYNVVSDAGNDYFFIFDMKHKEVKAVSKDENGNSVLVRWYVKTIF